MKRYVLLIPLAMALGACAASDDATEVPGATVASDTDGGGSAGEAGAAGSLPTPATTPPPPTTAPPESSTTTSTTTSTTVPALPPPTSAPTPPTPPPATPPPATPPPAPPTTALQLAFCVDGEINLFTEGRRGEIALYQQTLANLGYDPGEIDGFFGQNTYDAASQEILDNGNVNGPNGVFEELFPDDGAVLQPAFDRLGIGCIDDFDADF